MHREGKAAGQKREVMGSRGEERAKEKNWVVEQGANRNGLLEGKNMRPTNLKGLPRVGVGFLASTI
jgi:hypothetical protein